MPADDPQVIKPDPDKKVVLVAMIEPYTGKVDRGTEIWGINRTYKRQKTLDRLFFFDEPKHFRPDFVGDINALDIPVICRKHYDNIPKSEPYPLQEIMATFGGLRFYTCTVAYVLAMAIYEGFGSITLCGMYHHTDSSEYIKDVNCVNFWIGVASGKGIHIELVGDCGLLQPFPWDTGLYGYEFNANSLVCMKTLKAAYECCCQYPRCFKVADAEEEKPADDAVELEVDTPFVEDTSLDETLAALGANDDKDCNQWP